MPWQQLGFEDHAGRSTRDEPAYPVGVTGSVEMEDDVRRRTFALGIAVAGVAAPQAMARSAEQLRHELLRSASPSALVEEWEAIRDEYAIKLLRLPPAIVLRSLLSDLNYLNEALVAAAGQPASVALSRAGAHLAGMTAWAFGNLDDHTQAARWWRSAHHLAVRSVDRDTQLWVVAQEAVMALYQAAAPLGLTRARIADARSLAATLPATAAVAWLYCAEAQAAGMDDDKTAAQAALRKLHDTFGALSPTVVGDGGSFLGWAETRLDFTESFTYAHLGDYPAASAAQDRALAKFPAGVVRDPVKLELQRALCMAKAGASTEAERHALGHLTALDQPQHDLPIANLTARVVAALPAGRDSDDVRQLRRFTASRMEEGTA